MDFKCNLWVLLCIFAHLSMETKALDLSQNSGRQVCYRSSTIYMSFDKFDKSRDQKYYKGVFFPKAVFE